ncbi:MAG: SurA N-terminal domain-containing protein [Candidatus Omnitrophica bacterium]|nr:SurA N-terminal domain-containing protein [Candidatus Omnitrophota bacterium]
MKIKRHKSKPRLQAAGCSLQAKRISFLVFTCGLWLAACGFTNLYAQDRIVAIVNNDIVTQRDLNNFINFTTIQLEEQYKDEELEDKIQSMKSDLLDKLIDDRLILQEARREKINIEEARVKARIEDIKKRYASDKEFQNALLQQGMSQADIETKIKEQLLMYAIIDAKIKRKIMINPAEVTDYYENNKDKFIISEQREFESLSIDNENTANDLYQKLKNNEGLQDVAKENSLELNKFNAQKNGELRKEIEDVIFQLNLEEVSSPIKIENKYYIFKLVNIIPTRQQTLSENQDMIHAFLYNKKLQEELTKWVDELKQRSYIKIM